MRIIGGQWRGRRLFAPDGTDTRPTADRVKESLFNILGYRFMGSRVLDLFAGSGALGLECLSRGASEVVFNDVSKDSIGILKKNLEKLKLKPNGEEAKMHGHDYLVCLDAVKPAFDLIFIDPP